MEKSVIDIGEKGSKMILNELRKEGVVSIPSWLPENTVYLTYVGSVAYGASNETSDLDCYGITVPTKASLFPHLDGCVFGFDYPKKPFQQWQQHHVDYRGKEYDFQIFNIVKFFHLAMENNPAVIDTLYTPQECVLHLSHVGNRCCCRGRERVFWKTDFRFQR